MQIVKSTGRHEVMRGAKWICSHDSWGLGQRAGDMILGRLRGVSGDTV